jgi:hypothetical protein
LTTESIVPQRFRPDTGNSVTVATENRRRHFNCRGSNERFFARCALKELTLNLRRIDVAPSAGRFDDAATEYRNYRCLSFAALPSVLNGRRTMVPVQSENSRGSLRVDAAGPATNAHILTAIDGPSYQRAISTESASPI